MNTILGMIALVLALAIGSVTLELRAQTQALNDIAYSLDREERQ